MVYQGICCFLHEQHLTPPPLGTRPILTILRPQCGFHRKAGSGAPDKGGQDECGLGISISSLLPGTWCGLWLANLSDSRLLKPGAQPRRNSSCPLIFSLCPLRDPGQQGKSRPPCPTCHMGRLFVPEPPRQCKCSARLCSPGQMQTISAPSFPPAPSSQANVVVQGAQTLDILEPD